MYSSLAALLAAKPNGYPAERALAELTYAGELVKLHPEHTALFQKAADTLYAAFRTDGAVTRTACTAMETVLAPLSPIAKSLNVILCAHAHIDMNWMWGFHETAALTVDTFRTMLDLMREYPEFTFSQSQASVYKIVEEFAPEMLPEIRARVQEGRWEVTASTWVETDKNMPDGESLTRHILQTKAYLHDLLGVNPDSLQIDFEPDTFGHNQNVPEICTAGGVRYYYHCRGYDGHHIYRWRSPSGAELLCYREPMWYNAHIIPTAFCYLPAFCAENGISTALKVFGVGDHGGGPTRRDVEYLRDMAAWPIQPTLRFGTFRAFFETLDARRMQFPVVEGELNYVFTGCYTSQSRIKAANRIAEARMNEAEALMAMDSALTGADNDAKVLDNAWQELLFNHFHDIIPGSGTIDTREYAMGQFQRTLAAVDTTASRAMRSIAASIDTSKLSTPVDAESFAEGAGVGFAVGSRETHGGSFQFPQTERGGGLNRVLHVFNTTPYPRDEVISMTVWDYPGEITDAILRDEKGTSLPFTAQTEPPQFWGHIPTKLTARICVPALGYTTLFLSPGEAAEPIWGDGNLRLEQTNDEPLILDNGILRAVFDRETMALIHLTDLKADKVLIDRPACTFRDILEDPHCGRSAWCVGAYSRSRCINAENPVQISKRGADFIEYSITYRENSLTCRVFLPENAFALKFELSVNWFERGSHATGIPQLGFAVPLAWKAEQYRYDIPYGTIVRGSLRHDVPACSLAAADYDGGSVFLWADTKYGFRGADDTLFCDLLRASETPDPTPELGAHHMTLAVGIAPDGDILRASALLNHPLHCISGKAHPGTLPQTVSFLTVSGSARLCAVKNAQDSEGLIVRLVGTANGTAVLRWICPIKSCALTDSMERSMAPLTPSDNCVTVPVRCDALTSVRVVL